MFLARNLLCASRLALRGVEVLGGGAYEDVCVPMITELNSSAGYLEGVTPEFVYDKVNRGLYKWPYSRRRHCQVRVGGEFNAMETPQQCAKLLQFYFRGADLSDVAQRRFERTQIPTRAATSAAREGAGRKRELDEGPNGGGGGGGSGQPKMARSVKRRAKRAEGISGAGARAGGLGAPAPPGTPAVGSPAAAVAASGRATTPKRAGELARTGLTTVEGVCIYCAGGLLEAVNKQGTAFVCNSTTTCARGEHPTVLTRARYVYAVGDTCKRRLKADAGGHMHGPTYLQPKAHATWWTCSLMYTLSDACKL
jgi:hypothetical protein